MATYCYGDPKETNRYRAVTNNMAAMPGVTVPTFCCALCGNVRPVKGRTLVEPGNRKAGYACACCRPPEPVVRKPAARVRAAPKPAKPKIQRTLLTDDQVLACRAAHEFGCDTPARLARQYGTSRDYMRALLSYETRSKLIPKRPA